MKLVKMSLAAAVLLGTSAFAIDNIKVNGDAKVYYGTNNMGDGDLFEKGNEVDALVLGYGSYADAALRLGVTGDLLKGVSFGATGYAVSTLGLENNLVSQTWTGAHGARTDNGSSYAEIANGAQVDDASWMGELWLAATMGKTTVKAGRMELDTPLAFTEKWSIVPNTFEGAVVLNQDIPDTTLVGAWVGKHNGGGFDNSNASLVTTVSPLMNNNVNNALGLPLNTVLPTGTDAPVFVGVDGGVVAPNGKFSTFGTNGAYAAGVVNNSFKPLTAQAWYYNIGDIADAYWLQGDIDCSLVKGLKLGAQYANISTKGSTEAILTAADILTAGTAIATSLSSDTSGYAVKVGYEGVENLKISAAYSEVDKEGAIGLANVATGNGQSKLYTEAWWNYGYVGTPGAEAYNLTAEYNAGIAKVGVYYTDVSVQPAGLPVSIDMTEIALTASKSFGPLDATVAYIFTDANNQNMDPNGVDPFGLDGRSYDTVQAYLTLNF